MKPFTRLLKPICLIAAITAVHLLSAQRYFNGRSELGWSLGTSNYQGDLAHGRNLKGYHLAGGLYYKHQFSSYFSNRAQLTYLKVSGTDVKDRSYAIRNLSFQTPIYEFADMIEFNFQKFGMNYDDKHWTPYLFVGLAAFMFEPSRLENSDIKLRNLKTEGQRRGYSLFQPSMPIGFGYKTMSQPSKNHGTWIFALEGCWRKTFTDHLDDVSGEYPDFKKTVDLQGQGAAMYSQAQTLNGVPAYRSGTTRGDKSYKDWYYFIGFTMSYRFPGRMCAKM